MLNFEVKQLSAKASNQLPLSEENDLNSIILRWLQYNLKCFIMFHIFIALQFKHNGSDNNFFGSNPRKERVDMITEKERSVIIGGNNFLPF